MLEVKREILHGEHRDKTVAALQTSLYDLIDLALQGKQAHLECGRRAFSQRAPRT
jgi:DNA-binding ferritin-like protein